MDFAIVRYVLIFLAYFGHNLGTGLQPLDCLAPFLFSESSVTVRKYGFYAKAHRGKRRKARVEAFPLRTVEKKLRPVTLKGWAEIIRPVYEPDSMVCPKCGGTMNVIAFLTDHAVVDRIIDHLRLIFVADGPPPRRAFQEYFIASAAAKPKCKIPLSYWTGVTRTGISAIRRVSPD